MSDTDKELISLLEYRVFSIKEIDRLTSVLHANRCHPDFYYLVSSIPIQGLDRNQESETKEHMLEANEKHWRGRRPKENP